MKKLKLKHLDLDMVEMLTKEQLKDVFGGEDYGSGGSGIGSACYARCQKEGVIALYYCVSCSATDNVGVTCTKSNGNVQERKCHYIPTT